ncbi:MAG: hypothetical protein ACM3IH_05630, partial [Sphingobacteriales bacterium]
WKGLGADSEEKREPASDIDTILVDSLKALDPNRPIREADISPARLDRLLTAPALPLRAAVLVTRVRTRKPFTNENWARVATASPQRFACALHRGFRHGKWRLVVKHHSTIL